MIISHQHRYVFIEIPHTATTTISRELCEYYGGTPILHKHATYREYLRTASAEEAGYFCFAGTRNPLDIIVTTYFKLRTNHHNFYTDPAHWREQGGHVSAVRLQRFKYVQAHETDFAHYFAKFHRIPFDSWGSPRPADFDFIVRFEQLQEDFATVLARLGLAQVRPLPVRNKTGERAQDFRAYYTSELYGQAARICGPYMWRWGYPFPEEWGRDRPPLSSNALFLMLGFLRRHLMWRRTGIVRFLSRLRVKTGV